MELLKITALLQSTHEDRSVPKDALGALVFSPSVLGQSEPGEGFWTVGYASGAQPRSGVTPDDYVAWVRKRKGGVFTRLIGLGRTRNNDIVLPFDDISKYHAYFSVGSSDGEMSVADAGSKNGTFVNASRLDTKVPHAVASGSSVGFGSHTGLFFERSAFVSLLTAMLGTASAPPTSPSGR